MDRAKDVAASTDHPLHALCEVFETPYTKESTSRGRFPPLCKICVVNEMRSHSACVPADRVWFSNLAHLDVDDEC
jgi:hypothetical protein